MRASRRLCSSCSRGQSKSSSSSTASSASSECALPRTLFGEIPLVYGAQFQAGFRATEPSRVLKVDAPLYYDIAATSPELVRRMDELARERIGGLQKLAAEPHNAQVTLLGNRWDSACLDLRRFLERNQISFHWLTLDDPNLADHWPGPPPLGLPGAAARRWDDAHEAATARVRSLLGLQTAPRFQEYDRSSLAGDRRGSPPPCTAPQRAFARSSSSRRRQEARPRRRRASKTTSGFRAGSGLGAREPGASASQTPGGRDFRRAQDCPPRC